MMCMSNFVVSKEIRGQVGWFMIYYILIVIFYNAFNYVKTTLVTFCTASKYNFRARKYHSKLNQLEQNKKNYINLVLAKRKELKHLD